METDKTELLKCYFSNPLGVKYVVNQYARLDITRKEGGTDEM